MIAVPLVISLVVLVVLMGFASGQQVSSVRACLEQIHGQRLLELALDSAVEEACARLEAAPSSRGLPPPPATGRDLKAALNLPESVKPALAAQYASQLGVELGDVAIRSSDWKLDYRVDAPGIATIRERAVVEFKATLRIAGSRRGAQTFTVARYAEVSPDLNTSGARLKFQHNNMVLRSE